MDAHAGTLEANLRSFGQQAGRCTDASDIVGNQRGAWITLDADRSFLVRKASTVGGICVSLIGISGPK